MVIQRKIKFVRIVHKTRVVYIEKVKGELYPFQHSGKHFRNNDITITTLSLKHSPLIYPDKLRVNKCTRIVAEIQKATTISKCSILRACLFRKFNEDDTRTFCFPTHQRQCDKSDGDYILKPPRDKIFMSRRVNCERAYKSVCTQRTRLALKFKIIVSYLVFAYKELLRLTMTMAACRVRCIRCKMFS